MIKTEILSLTLTGGATYDCITPLKNDGTENALYSSITDITPTYSVIQVKAPNGGLKYKFNSGDEYVEIAAGDFLQHPYDAATPAEPCQDSIYILGAGTVKIEISYFV